MTFWIPAFAGMTFLVFAGELHAQTISIALQDSTAAFLQVDSVSRSEAWIELSGTDETPTKDDVIITMGNPPRRADILSIDSMGWKFRSRLALSFVLDNSGSMFHAYDSLVAMCDTLLDSLPAGAIGQAVLFDDRYRGADDRYTARSSTFLALHPFTDTMIALKQFWHCFDTVRTQFTPLYDAIAAAVTNIFERRQRGDTAHYDVLLVVTDGEDNASRTPLEELRELVYTANLRLFAVNFRVEEEGRLPWLARHTGGEYFLANNLQDLRDILHRVEHALSRQYRIRYRFPTLGPSSGRH